MEGKKVKIKDALSFRKAGDAISRLTEERDQLIAQRDELLALLKEAAGWLSGWASAEHELSLIRAAIAKCEVKS